MGSESGRKGGKKEVRGRRGEEEKGGGRARTHNNEMCCLAVKMLGGCGVRTLSSLPSRLLISASASFYKQEGISERNEKTDRTK